MHPHEEALIAAFVRPERRDRWRTLLGSAKRRWRFLDGLNHCQDFDPRWSFAHESPWAAAEVARLRASGATCWVISADDRLDGRERPLGEALDDAYAGDWGTLVSCVPGRLAFFFDERRTGRRLVLERPPG